MSVLVDSNVILDIATNDPNWFNWSATKLAEYSERDALVINPIIYAEVSIGFESVPLLRDLPKYLIVPMSTKNTALFGSRSTYTVELPVAFRLHFDL